MNKDRAVSLMLSELYDIPLDSLAEDLMQIRLSHYQATEKHGFSYRGVAYFSRDTTLSNQLATPVHEAMDNYLKRKEELDTELQIASAYLRAACNMCKQLGQLYYVLPESIHPLLQKIRLSKSGVEAPVIDQNALQWNERGKAYIMKRLLNTTIGI